MSSTQDLPLHRYELISSTVIWIGDLLFEFQILSLEIFVEDHRYSPTRKDAVEVTVPILSLEKEHRVSTKDIISRLQETNAGLTGKIVILPFFFYTNVDTIYIGIGPLNVSFPHRTKPEFKICFLKNFKPASPLDDARFQPDKISISDSQILLHVEQVSIIPQYNISLFDDFSSLLRLTPLHHWWGSTTPTPIQLRLRLLRKLR